MQNTEKSTTVHNTSSILLLVSSMISQLTNQVFKKLPLPTNISFLPNYSDTHDVYFDFSVAAINLFSHLMRIFIFKCHSEQISLETHWSFSKYNFVNMFAKIQFTKTKKKVFKIIFMEFSRELFFGPCNGF